MEHYVEGMARRHRLCCGVEGLARVQRSHTSSWGAGGVRGWVGVALHEYRQLLAFPSHACNSPKMPMPTTVPKCPCAASVTTHLDTSIRPPRTHALQLGAPLPVSCVAVVRPGGGEAVSFHDAFTCATHMQHAGSAAHALPLKRSPHQTHHAVWGDRACPSTPMAVHRAHAPHLKTRKKATMMAKAL